MGGIRPAPILVFLFINLYFYLKIIQLDYFIPVKIVGGNETEIEDVPYIVQMQIRPRYGLSCGGVIIGENFVLTAAHCLKGKTAKEIRIRSGSKELDWGEVHDATEIIVHPNYRGYVDHYDNDIAIVKVNQPFEFSNTTRPIELAEKFPKAGDKATVSGWGLTSENSSYRNSPILRKVVVPVLSFADCQAAYKGKLTQRMVCAGTEKGGKDTCKNDSGGPFVINGKLAGLVSWGRGCARPGYPGIYTNVKMFLPWIEEKIAQLSDFQEEEWKRMILKWRRRTLPNFYAIQSITSELRFLRPVPYF